MKTIGIICALDSEFAAIKDHYKDGLPQQVGLFTFFCAPHGEKQIVAAVCGIGKVNAAACAQIMISQFHADCIINSGVSGTLVNELHILDIVCATEVMHHDLLARFLDGTYFPGCAAFPADPKLTGLVADICAEQQVPCVSGRIVSGEQFVTNSAQKEEIRLNTGGITTEMEGAAIGHVCYLNQIPFAVVRCVSDGADDQGGMDYDKFLPKAAARCAGITLALIDRIS